MQIASATSDDLDALAVLLREGDLHHQPFDPRGLRQGEPAPADGFAAALDDPDQLVLVARAGAGIVAMLRARLNRRDASRLHAALAIVTIEEVVVTAAARRHGLARALMAEAEAWARTRGAHRLQLSFYEANEQAAAFYAALGYAPLTRTMVRDL